MRRILGLTVVGLGIFLGPAPIAHADISLAKYIQMRNEPDQKQVLEVYIQGAGNGIGWMNSIAKRRFGSFLYCQPEKLSIASGEYKNILDSFLLTPKGDDLVQKGGYVEIALIFALMDKFPCR